MSINQQTPGTKIKHATLPDTNLPGGLFMDYLFTKMHHIVDVGIAAHRIPSDEWIVVQPGQILPGQAGSPGPAIEFGRFDKLAVAVGSPPHHAQQVFGADDGK